MPSNPEVRPMPDTLEGLRADLAAMTEQRDDAIADLNACKRRIDELVKQPALEIEA